MSYRAANLDGDDRLRATLPRSVSAQQDWQVSRALLHGVRAMADDGVHSLSHKQGHAVCAAAPAGWRVGVDLERITPRHVMRLADWVCAPPERQVLAGLDGHDRLAHFYLLWTLKEAFIKAAGLVFPADMSRVGLRVRDDGGAVLRAPPGAWRACAWRLAPDWLVSMVWQAPAPQRPRLPQWCAPGPCLMQPLRPPRTLLGQWSAPP